jgi:hypothetical protein
VRRLSLSAVLLLAAAAGCGGGGSSGGAESGPEKQVRAYLAAFARGDGRAACGLLTPQARAGVPHLSEDIRSPDCERAIRELARTSERLPSPSVSVDVNGDRATAKIANTKPPYQSQALLEKADGRWRIAFPPAVLQRYKSPPGIPSDLPKRRKKRS